MRTVMREVKRIDSQIKFGVIDESRVAVYEKLKDFISKGGYFKYAQKDDLLECLFEDDAVIAYRLSVSEMAVRKLKSNLSKALYEKLGYDVFDKVLYGDESALKEVDEALTLADFNVTSQELYPREVIEFVKGHVSSDDKVYDLADLSKEFEYLRKYSLKRIKTEALNCDIDKLNFILKRLDESDFGSELDKEIVRKLLFD